MNIFLESANLDDIRSATAAGLADGVAFSYVAFSADSPEATQKEWLEEISREFALPVCVPVGAVASGDIYTEARELAKVSDHIIVQIPLVEDSLIPIAKLSAEGVVICATFVFNGAQAVIASKCGASMVRVTLPDRGDNLDRSARFRIDALLSADPAPEPVSFDTSLEPTTRRVDVSTGR